MIQGLDLLTVMFLRTFPSEEQVEKTKLKEPQQTRWRNPLHASSVRTCCMTASGQFSVHKARPELTRLLNINPCFLFVKTLKWCPTLSWLMCVFVYSVQPCMHTFCAACYSGWMERSSFCPTCRCPVERIRKNHILNNLVEAYLLQHPGTLTQLHSRYC